MPISAWPGLSASAFGSGMARYCAIAGRWSSRMNGVLAGSTAPLRIKVKGWNGAWPDGRKLIMALSRANRMQAPPLANSQRCSASRAASSSVNGWARSDAAIEKKPAGVSASALGAGISP